jgi:hypothetical protein
MTAEAKERSEAAETLQVGIAYCYYYNNNLKVYKERIIRV